MKTLLSAVVGAVLAVGAVALHAEGTLSERQVSLAIESRTLAEALDEWAQKSGFQIVVKNWPLTKKLTAPNLKGTFSAQAALEQLLEGSPLTYDWVSDNLVSIRERTKPPSRATWQTIDRSTQQKSPLAAPKFTGDALTDDLVAGAREDSAAPRSGFRQERPEVNVRAIPEVLVLGARLLNTDIRRSRDDAQPYVVFGRQQLAQSGATSVDEFLRQRLTMNSVALTGMQSGNIAGNRSEVNLRGLGANQTLILVDGRRIAGVSAGGEPAQPDINGIPLAAIERIEILPSTASGIYGGSATGGVVNVILRRDYEGAEVNLNYESTFKSGSALRRIDASKGFNFNDGNTNLLLAGTYSAQDSLAFRDRKFQRRGIEHILRNNPSFFLDGLSAPPLGATTNVSSLDGSNLVLDDGTELPSSITFVPTGYAGTASDGGAALASNAGRFNLGWADSGQSGAGGRSLLAEPTLKSLQATLRQRIGSRLSLFLDASNSENTSQFELSGLDFGAAFPGVVIDSGALNNPFQQPIQVTVPSGAGDGVYEVETRSRRLAGGLIFELSRDWVLGLDYTWNRASIEQSQPRSSFDGFVAISAGSLDVLRDPGSYSSEFEPFLLRYRTSPFRSTTSDANLRLSGPIWALPGGDVTLSALLERRKDSFGDGEGREFSDSGPGTPLVETDRLLEKTQTVESAYLELRLPIFSRRNAVPGFDSLELQFAARTDWYETDWAQARVTPGSTDPVQRGESKLDSTDPTVGIRWEVTRDIALRASYGTGFRPPAVSDFSKIGPFDFSAFVVDPLRGGEFVAATGTFGGNPDLKPEESESWSVGMMLRPRFLPDFRLSVDYTRIDKSDNIVNLLEQEVVDNEAALPSRVTRAAPDAGDPFGVGPITAIDATALNIARTKVEAFDIQLDYSWTTARLGSFELIGLATRQTHYETQLLPTAPILEQVGVASSHPLKFKANATLRWSYNDWAVGWTSRYFDSYLVSRNPTIVLNQGSRHVPSQVYHDLFASYRTTTAMFGMSALEIQAGIKNVLDEEPPFDAANSSAGYYSPFGDARLSSYYLGVKMSF